MALRKTADGLEVTAAVAAGRQHEEAAPGHSPSPLPLAPPPPPAGAAGMRATVLTLRATLHWVRRRAPRTTKAVWVADVCLGPPGGLREYTGGAGPEVAALARELSRARDAQPNVN
jgi:hypothetical protein